MIGIIGEAESDVETLAEIVKKLKDDSKLAIKKKGFNGCAEMFVKSAKLLAVQKSLGCTKFIICYDSDGANADARKQEIIDRIIKPSGVQGIFCALVPVQEIEAWILADLDAVSKVIPSFRTKDLKLPTSPELIASPKEHLEKLVRKDARPLYSHAVHNVRVAAHLNLAQVQKKCPSFLPLFNFVTLGQGNV